MKVCFVTPSLNIGGSEIQLMQLALELKKRGHDIHVISFYSGGVLAGTLQAADIGVIELNKRIRRDVLKITCTLWRQVRGLAPHIVYSYREANIAAALLPTQRTRPLIWNIRASANELDVDWRNRLTGVAYRRLARRSMLILANSWAGVRWAERLGMPQSRIRYLPNGIDTKSFRPGNEDRDALRKSWGIPEDAILVGLVARLDPVKDHATFLRAASLLQKTDPKLFFICMGDGPFHYKQKLEKMARDLSLGSRLRFLGHFPSMPSAYTAMDVVCSSSISEGFPNAIAEAMACAVQVVGTNVGDTADIIGKAGIVVEPRNPIELARAIHEISLVPPDRKRELGRIARQRIIENFSVETLGRNVEEVLQFVTSR